jgi:hypothetical protein
LYPQKDLNTFQVAETLGIAMSKKDLMRDVLTIFTDRIVVAFKNTRTRVAEKVEG